MSTTLFYSCMNLNRLDWMKAQDLLLHLVQILTPFAEKGAEKKATLLNNRFFVPPPLSSEETPAFRHPVSLLRATQEQLDLWIEQLPPTAGTPVEKKEGRGEAGAVKKEGDRPSRPPLFMQAGFVIKQVRDVISSLCTSANLVDPKAPPLRDALVRIKPLIDQLIDAVSHEGGMHSADQEKQRETRFPLPSSARQPLLKKFFPLPPPHIPEGKPIRSTPSQNREEVHTAIRIEPEKDPEALFAHPPKGESVRPVDRMTSLPAAPFTPDTRSLTAAQKKKKKKRFWGSEEEKEDPPS